MSRVQFHRLNIKRKLDESFDAAACALSEKKEKIYYYHNY